MIAPSATAALQPIRRDFGELTLPRLRAGTVHIPAGHGRGRLRVLVDLRLPPLAAVHARALQSTGGARLNASSHSSRAYLARLASAQRVAAVAVRRAVPQARISRRFRVVMDALTVDLPAKRLPELARVGAVRKIYPSLRYSLALNQSPSVIGLDSAAAGLGGSRGQGIKIGVVDDGVDPTNPFFDPIGFTYPAGFPRGGLQWTTPKVIVARTFPGPGSGRRGRLAVDRRASFHGTHVAGIAAGDSGTTAPAGPDHPLVTGLTGVAPRAWIGNYRVFTVPTPIGHVANTPEIVAAFEAAVLDRMDVINFSGGGPETDPANDALIEAVHNVAAAGVIPVIAAGNDRDDFGLGSVGSPGTAPDAISVAAVSNSHVFAPALTVVASGAPQTVKQIPFDGAAGSKAPPAWGTVDQTLVDVGSIVGADGKPVDRRLCGTGTDPNQLTTNVPPHSLDGAIALVSRGHCTFVSKALRARAAGAVGIVIVDNRRGEANGIPLELSLPAGMIADLDGARLRAVMATSGGRTTVRVGRDPLQIDTGRSGVVTSFSSGGPTTFGHRLKPDLAAPGGQILSSTLPEFAGSPFAVFDGTSMATPHVTGAAALLVERHPDWTPVQVKSALVATAGPAWADTARTVEAPVFFEGGGLIDVPRADDPQLFTDPVSLSYGDLNVNRGATSESLVVNVSDAGDGAGTWQVEVQPQASTSGASVDVQPLLSVAPGTTGALVVRARASADAVAGDDYGFVTLRRGAVTRRIPYDFTVTRPALESVTPFPLQRFQLGSTERGPSRVSSYRYPTAPFGPSPDYDGPPVQEDGAERLFETHLDRPAANLGVAVISSTAGSVIDPWFLGSADENDVQGYPGTPVNVNALTFDYRFDIGAAGALFPRQKRYFVAVDSGRDQFSGQSLAGSFLLRSWVNDVRPPVVKLLTKRVAAGRPLLVARVIDTGAGVDPYSLAIGYRSVLVAAAAYDPFSGIAAFPLPGNAPRIPAGRTRGLLVASDYQEAKNVNTFGQDIMPNTAFHPVRITSVRGSAVTWLSPAAQSCADRSQRLLVAASSTKPIAAVRFFDGRRRIAADPGNAAGLYGTTWSTKGARKGGHELRAVVLARGGRTAVAERTIRVCR